MILIMTSSLPNCWNSGNRPEMDVGQRRIKYSNMIVSKKWKDEIIRPFFMRRIEDACKCGKEKIWKIK